MEERKQAIEQKNFSIPSKEKRISNEKLFKFIEELKKGLMPEDLKSIISFIKDPVTKLIAQKLLLDSHDP